MQSLTDRGPFDSYILLGSQSWPRRLFFYPPGRKKQRVSTRGLIEFSFNLLNMNIYTPEIWSFIWRRRRWRRRRSRFFLSLNFFILTQYTAQEWVYLRVKGKFAKQKSYGFNLTTTTMTTMTKPIFFVFKFLHTHTVYSSYITIYVYKGKLCRTKVLWV